jgi:hypothetical protein
LKIRERSKKKKHVGKIIGLIILAVIVAAGVYSYYLQKEDDKKYQWYSSGPFAINKNQYKLGENVFLVASNLQPSDIGEFDVVTPKGNIFEKIPFNGTMKSGFHQFFKPNTERSLALCNATDLVGHWSIVFKGVPYKSIPFKIVNQWIQGAQAEILPVPKGLDPC